MSADRLPSALEAAALVRTVSADGGFAAILKRGDPDRGTLLLIIGRRGEHVTCLQRRFDLMASTYAWERVGPQSGESSEVLRKFLLDQQRFDPDCWQIELDIAQPERFIAEMIASG